MQGSMKKLRIPNVGAYASVMLTQESVYLLVKVSILSSLILGQREYNKIVILLQMTTFNNADVGDVP